MKKYTRIEFFEFVRSVRYKIENTKTWEDYQKTCYVLIEQLNNYYKNTDANSQYRLFWYEKGVDALIEYGDKFPESKLSKPLQQKELQLV